MSSFGDAATIVSSPPRGRFGGVTSAIVLYGVNATLRDHLQIGGSMFCGIRALLLSDARRTRLYGTLDRRSP